MRMTTSLFGFFGLIAVIVLTPRTAHAYIDPGTGSFILQMLIASLLGALFTVKLWFGAAKRFFQRVIGGNSRDQRAKSDVQADGAVNSEGDPAETP